MSVDAIGGASSVAGAIRKASQATGASFDYLLATAKVESNFNPSLTVPTSSARGLFQFIEQTWLAMLKQGGAALGLGAYADGISKTPSGRYVVEDPALRDEIMHLRNDPTANALMAGVFTNGNAAALAQSLGRPPTGGELYVAHFLGPAGGAKLIALAARDPQANAGAAFPQAAQANPAIFFDRSGRARSASEVYRLLAGRYEAAHAATARLASPDVAAGNGSAMPPAPVADPAGTAQALAAAVPPPAAAREDRPVFHALFRTGAAHAAVAPVVSALWSRPTPVAAARVEQPVTARPRERAETQRGGPLDLFQERAPDVRTLFGNKG